MQIKNSFTPKVLVYNPGGSFTQDLIEIKSTIPYEFISIQQRREVISNIYDLMPWVVLAYLKEINEEELNVFESYKKDPVLCHIPLMIVSKNAQDPYLGKLADENPLDGEHLGDIAVQLKALADKAQHQLDVNPFTALPGYQTTVFNLENAISLGGAYSICTIRIRQHQMFRSSHGGISTDVLFNKIIKLIRKMMQEYDAEETILGHVGMDTFATIISEKQVVPFAKKLVDEFDKVMPEMVEDATDAKHHSAADPLKNAYAYEAPVTLSVAVLPTEDYRAKGSQGLSESSNRVHRELLHEKTSVVGVGDEIIRSQDQKSSNNTKKQELHSLFQDVEYFMTEGKVEVFFQPIVDYWDRNPHGYEFLSRFIKEDDQYVHPELLFNAAREMGKIAEFDFVCLERMLRKAKEKGILENIFVNLNRESFIDLKDRIDVLDKVGFPNRQIVLEITEQSLVRERDKILSTKLLLDEKGIKTAYDDAGTGAVSFREAAEIKPNYIKFDRALISGITRFPLKQRHVLSMRAFGRGIGAKTIAEGIELESEFTYLKKIRLDLAQGYHIAKPSKDLMNGK